MPPTVPPPLASSNGPELAHTAVRNEILNRLGRPPALLHVSVRPLWAGRYRVNVVVGDDPTAARISDTYFVIADDQGRVTSILPPVVRRY